MKRYLLLLPAITLVYFTLSSYSTGSSGTPAGVNTAKTGCGGTGCHGAKFGPIYQKLTLAERGKYDPVLNGKYKPGVLYDIAFWISGLNPIKQKFGYIMLVTDNAGNQAGTWTPVAPAPEYKLTTKGQYTVVEHPNPLDLVSGINMTMGLGWTAPPKGTGDITIYIAVNGCNNNGIADTGDRWVLLKATYKEDWPATVDNIEESKFNIYPNPANSILNIDIQNSTSNKYHYTIYSMNGVMAAHGHLGNNVNTIDVSALASGMHFISISNGMEQKVITFNKL